MGYYDHAARYAANADPKPVIARLLRGQEVALHFQSWEETVTTTLPGVRENIADKIAFLVADTATAEPWLLVVEFQARHDADKLDVTFATAGQLRLHARHGNDGRGKYRIVTALVYLSGACPEAVLDMRLPGGQGSRHEALIWNVAEDNATVALDDLDGGRTTWGILFWLALMHGGGERAVILRWKEMVLRLAPPHHHSALARIALVFATLAGCYTAWEDALEDWNMTDVELVNRWTEKAVQQSQLADARAYLKRVLDRRFPGQVPSAVLATIDQQPGVSLLQDWFDAAMSAASIEDFIKVLRQ